MPGTHRTERNTLKIRQKATGLVFEREGPDAREFCATGAFEAAPADAASIRERLLAMEPAAIQSLCVQSSGRVAVDQPWDFTIDQLVPEIESGRVTFP